MFESIRYNSDVKVRKKKMFTKDELKEIQLAIRLRVTMLLQPDINQDVVNRCRRIEEKCMELRR